MTLFDESVAQDPARERTTSAGWPRRTVVGAIALLIALAMLLVMSFLPTDYVLQKPGPVYNTIGSVTIDDEEVPLIEVDGADTYPTSGELDLTTVQVVGNREHPISWIELAIAWMDSSRAIVPIDVVFPEGVSSEEREEQNAVMMTDSQGQASAAALTELGYDVPADIRVVSIPEGSPSVGVLKEGDRIVAADGEELHDVTELREIINAGEGADIELEIERQGERRTEMVGPEEIPGEGGPIWMVGVNLSTTYELPVDVSIQLDNVGGPSAGMMFALGIIDVLTEEELTGGETIAGTGTITATGEVGPIGGIRQKLHGARDEGAEFFLAPSANCGEVVGHVPDGLQVVEVETLESALEAVEAIGDGAAADLPTCSAG
ncbi:S16 family serine protease [Microbacterium sp. G2-8]|uniref:YlbL family protein n=1 Tax=Microbacterium sp. G2-8 TaxID=2842454 RepID=UPI0027E2308C|nr:S16 family serine protease [Microbacterium sp. G2-8]